MGTRTKGNTRKIDPAKEYITIKIKGLVEYKK